MSALPPIEPSRPLYPVQRIRERQPQEEKERRFGSEPEDEGQEPEDEHEGDDRPHVDIRV